MRGPVLQLRNARPSEAAFRSARFLKHDLDVCGHGGYIPRRYLGGPGGEYRLMRGPVLQMRIARQSKVASRSASAIKHELNVCGHGGHALRRYLRWPGGKYRLLEDPNLRIRNVRQSEAASRSASVLKHEVDVCGQG